MQCSSCKSNYPHHIWTVRDLFKAILIGKVRSTCAKCGSEFSHGLPLKKRIALPLEIVAEYFIALIIMLVSLVFFGIFHRKEGKALYKYIAEEGRHASAQRPPASS